MTKEYSILASVRVVITRLSRVLLDMTDIPRVGITSAVRPGSFLKSPRGFAELASTRLSPELAPAAGITASIAEPNRLRHLGHNAGPPFEAAPEIIVTLATRNPTHPSPLILLLCVFEPSRETEFDLYCHLSPLSVVHIPSHSSSLFAPSTANPRRHAH